MSSQAQFPLAWSQSGDPIELPPTAVLWRVRRLNGGPRGGAPELVYGEDGLPLTVEIDVTPLDFAAAVDQRAGKYRLDALDATKKPIPDVASAYVIVQGKTSPAEALATPPPDMARAFDVIERLARTLAEALERQTSHLASLVEVSARAAAETARLPRRNDALPAPLVPMVVAPATPAVAAPATASEAEQAEPDSSSAVEGIDRWVEAVLPYVGPMLPQLGMALMQKFMPSMFAAPATAPATPAPVPVAAAPTAPGTAEAGATP